MGINSAILSPLGANVLKASFQQFWCFRGLDGSVIYLLTLLRRHLKNQRGLCHKKARTNCLEVFEIFSLRLKDNLFEHSLGIEDKIIQVEENFRDGFWDLLEDTEVDDLVDCFLKVLNYSILCNQRTLLVQKNCPLIGGVRLLESFSISVLISRIKHFSISLRCSWVDWWLAGSSQTIKREKGYQFHAKQHCLSSKISKINNIKNNNKNEISNKIFL